MSWRSSRAPNEPLSPPLADRLCALVAKFEEAIPGCILDTEFNEDPTCPWASFVIGGRELLIECRAERVIITAISGVVVLDLDDALMEHEVMPWIVRVARGVGATHLSPI